MEKQKKKTINLMVRTVTGVIFVAAIVSSFLQPLAMEFLFAIITGLTAWEFTGLVNQREGVKVNRFISTVAAVYFFMAVGMFCSGSVKSIAVFVPYLLTLIYLFVSELYLRNQDPINSWSYTAMCQLYIALPFSMVNILAFNNYALGQVIFTSTLPLSVFVFLWASDTGAYCTGSLIGRHKLFPRISPAKSWEGSIGGAVVALICAVIFHFCASNSAMPLPLSLAQWLGLAAVVVIFGTWGDLVESLMKRTLGIKDSGTILPGHGGMLDRFDSSLMALPAAVVYLFSLQIF